MIRLYELRSEKGLSQRKIAERFNISQSTYNNWENSKTQPSISQLLSLAEFFGVSVDYLLGNCDDFGNITYKDSFIKNNEVELINTYRKLSQAAQQNILDFMKNSTTNL